MRQQGIGQGEGQGLEQAGVPGDSCQEPPVKEEAGEGCKPGELPQAQGLGSRPCVQFASPPAHPPR